MIKAKHSFRFIYLGMMLLLISGRFAAVEAGVFDKMCSWLDTKTSWGDNKKVQKTADLLATDGVSNGFESLSEQLDAQAKSLAKRDIDAGRKFLDKGITELEKTKSGAVKNLNDLKQSAQNSYREAKNVNPNLKVYDHFNKYNSQTNFKVKSSLLRTQISDLQNQIDKNISARNTLGKNAPGTSESTPKGGAGFFQKLGSFLTAIDISGATGRITGEFYEAFEGTSTFRSAFGRMVEEGARIKYVGITAAAGAGVGAMAGPGAIVASPVFAVAAGAAASKVFAETAGASSEKTRQYLADAKAREKYAADEQKLAARRAELAARKEQERIDKKLALQAKSAQHKESLKYLADLRSRVAAFNERSRLEDEARRKKDEQYELEQAKQRAPQKAAQPVVAAATPVSKTNKPAPAKSGSVSRSFSTGAYEITVTVSGASLISETPPKKQHGSLNAGELRLAASSSQCTIHVSYNIKHVYVAQEDKGASTFVSADYLELNENWANSRPVQQKYASSQIHKGNGPHSGEFSIPVEANHMIKKYMINTDSTFLTSDIYLSVLIVSAGNRHLLAK